MEDIWKNIIYYGVWEFLEFEWPLVLSFPSNDYADKQETCKN